MHGFIVILKLHRGNVHSVKTIEFSKTECKLVLFRISDIYELILPKMHGFFFPNSVVELLIDKSGSSGGSNIIVLRSLRLLRIFKLVRPMRHQLVVMIRTMSSVMTFFALLFLFMFTFAILGMHLFGDKFMFDGKVARSNFDSFLWAMVTVFQVKIC